MRNLATWLALATVISATGVTRADEVFPVVHTEAIAVRVIDGLTGMPRPRAVVVVVAGYSEHDLDRSLWRQEAMTDDTGAVTLTDGLRNLPLLRVEVVKKNSCAREGFSKTFSMELTRRDGLSGSNRCGIMTVKETAGSLTVFVADRKPWLKHRAKSMPAEMTDPEFASQPVAPRLASGQQSSVKAAPQAIFPGPTLPDQTFFDID